MNISSRSNAGWGLPSSWQLQTYNVSRWIQLGIEAALLLVNLIAWLMDQNGGWVPICHSWAPPWPGSWTNPKQNPKQSKQPAAASQKHPVEKTSPRSPRNAQLETVHVQKVASLTQLEPRAGAHRGPPNPISARPLISPCCGRPCPGAHSQQLTFLQLKGLITLGTNDADATLIFAQPRAQPLVARCQVKFLNLIQCY